MGSQSLVVPMVIWGHSAPTHCVSSIHMTADFRHIATGCNDGQIIVWQINDQYQVLGDILGEAYF